MKYVISIEDSRLINLSRALCIVLVLFIHSYCINLVHDNGSVGYSVCSIIQFVLSQNIARGAVPCLFLISSILLYRKEYLWVDNIKKKTKTLLVPYLLLNTIWIILFIVCQSLPYVNAAFTNPQYNIARWGVGAWIDAYIGFTGMPLLYPLWFVRDLLLLNIFSKVILKGCRKYPFLFLIASILLYLFDVNIPSYNIFLNPFQSLFYWIVGCLMVNKDIHFNDILLRTNHFSYICGLFVVFVIIGIVLPQQYNVIRIVNHNFVSFFSMLLIIKLSKKICSLKGYVESLFMRIAKYSFAIYLLHELWLSFAKKMLLACNPDSLLICGISYFLLPCVILVYCLYVAMLLEKRFPSVYLLITGGRKFKEK